MGIDYEHKPLKKLYFDLEKIHQSVMSKQPQKYNADGTLQLGVKGVAQNEVRQFAH